MSDYKKILEMVGGEVKSGINLDEILDSLKSDLGIPADQEYLERVDSYPRYVFEVDAEDREPGSHARILNMFGLSCGGTVIRKIGRAYLVSFLDQEDVVHEPRDSW